MYFLKTPAGNGTITDAHTFDLKPPRNNIISISITPSTKVRKAFLKYISYYQKLLMVHSKAPLHTEVQCFCTYHWQIIVTTEAIQ